MTQRGWALVCFPWLCVRVHCEDSFLPDHWMDTQLGGDGKMSLMQSFGDTVSGSTQGTVTPGFKEPKSWAWKAERLSAQTAFI